MPVTNLSSPPITPRLALGLTVRYGDFAIACQKLLKFDRTPLYDGPTVIGMRYLVAARGILNPYNVTGVLTYNAADPNNPVVATVQLDGNSESSGFATDLNVRQYMMTPRRQLHVFMDPGLGVYTPYNILTSPRTLNPGEHAGPPPRPLPGMPTDSNNGPIPLGFNVVEYQGTKSIVVEYAIQTDVMNDERDAPGPILLSHRFSDEHQLDQDFYPSRIIQGHAIFRTDYLLNQSLVPDDFRRLLFHPVAASFKRDWIRVVADPQGNRIDYVIVDKLHPTAIAAYSRNGTPNDYVSQVTRVECVERIRFKIPGLQSIQYQSALFAGGLADAAIETAAATATDLETAGALAGLVKYPSVAGIIKSVADVWGATMPSVNFLWTVRVWGRNNANHQHLLRAAMACVNTRKQQRLLNVTAGVFGTPANFADVEQADQLLDVSFDVVGRFVEVTAESSMSWFQQGMFVFDRILALLPQGALNAGVNGLGGFIDNTLGVVNGAGAVALRTLGIGGDTAVFNQLFPPFTQLGGDPAPPSLRRQLSPQGGENTSPVVLDVTGANNWINPPVNSNVPLSDASRPSTFLERCVAQALQDPYGRNYPQATPADATPVTVPMIQ